MPLLLQTSGIPNLVFKLGHCVEVLGYLNSQWAKTKAGQNNIRAMSADLHKDSCGLGPRNCQFENRVSQILAKAKECVMDYNSWVRMIARNHLKESSKIWLQFKNVEYVVGKWDAFMCWFVYYVMVHMYSTAILHVYILYTLVLSPNWTKGIVRMQTFFIWIIKRNLLSETHWCFFQRFFYENNELWQYALQSVVVNIILYLPLSQLVELDVKVRAM